MTIVASLILALVVFVFVVSPFYRRKWQPVAVTEEGRIRELHSRRDTSYSMLKELEFDYQSGILTEEDYNDLVSRYKEKAIAVLKDMDVLEKDSGSEDEIEKQVNKLRRKRNPQASRTATSVEDGIEQQVQQLRQNRTARFCSKCGAKLREGDRFCASCGIKLS